VENDLKELELSRQRVNDLELKMEKLGLDPNMSFMKCDEISDKVVSALAEKSPLSEDKAYQESSQPAYKAGVKVKLKWQSAFPFLKKMGRSLLTCIVMNKY